MGIFSSILGGIFGGIGSKQTGKIEGKEIRGAVRDNLDPFTQDGIQSSNFLQDFLMGRGGSDEVNRFADSTGINFLRDQGRSAIGGSQAAMGKLGSGATGKALAEFGQNLAQTKQMDFLNMIQQQAGTGAATGSQAVTGMTNAATAKADGKRAGIGVIGDVFGSIF